MSELSCDTLFIGRNETHDLSRYRNSLIIVMLLWCKLTAAVSILGARGYAPVIFIRWVKITRELDGPLSMVARA